MKYKHSGTVSTNSILSKRLKVFSPPSEHHRGWFYALFLSHLQHAAFPRCTNEEHARRTPMCATCAWSAAARRRAMLSIDRNRFRATDDMLGSLEHTLVYSVRACGRHRGNARELRLADPVGGLTSTRSSARTCRTWHSETSTRRANPGSRLLTDGPSTGRRRENGSKRGENKGEKETEKDNG